MIRLSVLSSLIAVSCVAAQTAPTANIQLLQQRIWAKSERPLKVGCMGDSVGYGLLEAMLPSLDGAFGTNGAVSATEYGGIGIWTGSNWMTGGCSWSGGAQRLDYPTTNWFAMHYLLPADGSVTWTNRVSADASVLADSAMVTYIAGPSGGTFSLRISTNSGQWAQIATIEAKESDRRAISAKFPLPPGNYRIQVVGIEGTSVILNAGLWRETATGVRSTEMFNVGINLSHITRIPEPIWKPVFSGLQLDVLFWEMKECHGDLTTNQFAALWPSFENMLREGFAGTTIVLVGTTPQRDNNDLLLWQNAFVRERAIASGWVFWDGYTPFGSYENALARGWVADSSGVHPSIAGDRVRAKALMNNIGIGRLNAIGISGSGPRQLELGIEGLPDLRFAIEELDDVLGWQPIVTNVFTSGRWTTVEIAPPADGLQFYRAVLLP